MKTGSLIQRVTFIVLLIFLILLSVSIALITYRYYGVIARGIVGIILMYLLYFFGRYSNMDVSTHTLLSDPKKGKYLISAFVVPLISYWAMAQIYEMVLFFWKR
jgi:hypothetical protein